MLKNTSLFLALTLSMIGVFFVLNRTETAVLVVTSDIHVSNPAGRWPYTTSRYQSLLDLYRDESPELFFIVGDVVDNVVGNGPARPGNISYWESEFSIYKQLNKRLPKTEFLHTYGPGHDYIGDVSLEYAEKFTGIKRRGFYKWENVDLIWFTVYPAAFSNNNSNPSAISDDDYDWLNKALSSSKNAILLWHVPIRTDDTEKHGVWSNDHNLSIPYADRLYTLLRNHKSKIRLIINGHIHKPIKSSFEEIPVYLCPLFGTGCSCSIKQGDDFISIEPASSCGINGAMVNLNGT